MARKSLSRWVWLGIVLGIAGGLLVGWLVARVNNTALSAAWSLLLLAVILQPLYQRWSRRRRSRPGV